jgi:hypothetical protein
MRTRLLVTAVFLALTVLGSSEGLAHHLSRADLAIVTFSCNGFIRIAGETEYREVGITFPNASEGRYRWDDGNDDGRGDFSWAADIHKLNFRTGGLKPYYLKQRLNSGWSLRRDSNGNSVGPGCSAFMPGES